jgi:hypothetical protein
MPKLSWATINDVPPDTEVTIMGSRLPLRQYRHIPRFLRVTLRIRKQLAHADGLVGYALDAELTRKTFWTVSAWATRDQLNRFAGADPHHAQTDAIRPAMLDTTFVFWTGSARDLPVAWADVRERILASQSDPGVE